MYEIKTITLSMNNISIITAAKNEEKNLPFLIDALLKLNYPKDNFEVIIVDDNSTDGTFQKAKELTEAFSNFTIIKAETKKYEGKRGALDIGIKKCKHDYILITDADCLPEKNWLIEYSKKFNEGYDFLFGVAPFIKEKSFMNKISCFENLRSHILTFFFAKIGQPYSAAARNFGFNKIAFYKIGGYRNTTQTQSGDDDLLLREAVKHRIKIGTVEAEGSFVFSKTKKTFKEFFRQKARHVSTSNYYLLKTKLAIGGWHLANLVFLFSPILFSVSNLFLILFFLKILFDIIIVKSKQKKYGCSFNLLEIFYLQIIYEIFLIVHYIYGSIAKPPWK
ncbi:MAG: hypothetical protein A2068_09460 [Ignavibacteria bacterium GWB2_35_6b]|nr:MAG: hypothetical protein A2068_09460 [Ignavibacteria bacterium GWB2_35_6b]